MSDMTEAQRKNLKKITVTPGQYGTKYTVEIHDAQNAVNMIAKHLGLLIDRLADEDVDKIGDLIELGVARIRKLGDPDAWKAITFEGEMDRT
jgi:cobalamin biosynthesis protein CbiD